MIDVVCYYYDPVKVPLLRDGLLPALDEIRGDVRVHVERHWLHGPHLRIRLEEDAAARAIVQRLRAYLRRHPSTADISPDALLAQATEAGLAELIKPPYEPIHPDNTVALEPSNPGRIRELLGSDALVELRAEGLRLGLPAVRASLVEGSNERIRLATTALAVHASRYPPGLGHGYHSYVSHLEDFLLHSDADGKVRARLDALWQRNADAATELVERVAHGHPTDRVEAAWQAWTISNRLNLEDAYDRGELTAEPNPRYGERAYELGDRPTIQRYNFAERTKFSDYHTKLSQVDLDDPLIKRPLAVYRFGTNVLYQLLAVCDVTPMERYLAARFVVGATERTTGLTWADRLSAMARATA
ncbi:MAG TPA: lantibiotic dehydratase C-terminal domain-containing protein [Pseudonocardiaceae bacterium]|nr:lantibiotic dehydratase C-terminal domain-containing protein [Pseudonocardiaceae bacterium]